MTPTKAKTRAQMIEETRKVYSFWRSLERTAERNGWTEDMERYSAIADRWHREMKKMVRSDG